MRLEPLEARLAMAVDAAAAAPLIDFDVAAFRPDGSAVASLAPGDEFVLKVFATDVRDVPLGVFAAYLDVTWDGSLAVAIGPLSHSPGYLNGKLGTVGAGIIDDAGGFSGAPRYFGATVEVFSILMRATGTGTLVFTADPADVTPNTDALVHGENGNIDDGLIVYGSASVVVSGTGGTDSFQAVADTFGAQEDSQNNVFNPLANDSNLGSSANVLTIVAVGGTSHGGVVTIAANGKSMVYKPAANFAGNETFTYTVQNQLAERHTAAVTVEVAAVNDPPTTVDDHYTVAENSVGVQLPAHLNDSPDPDTGESIRIVGFRPGDRGGTVVQEGDFLYYTPRPGFVGIETIRYTIGDVPFLGPGSVGLTAEGTITIVVGNPSVPEAGVSLEGGVLEITGSGDDDRLVVSINRGRLRVTGNLAGEAVNQSFTARGVRKIVAELGDGNDALTVRPNMNAALRVNAGAGNDAVFAGLGAAILIGGDGDDTLRGGGKRDVLVGGLGSDRVVAGGANDLVIHGTTIYDNDIAAIDAIAAEWGSKRSVAVRRANIQHGTGAILGPLDVSLDEGLLEEEPGVIFYPLASRGR